VKEVEILIVGGGPAGLLAASCLGIEHEVALIERAVLGRTTKYWATTERRLRKYGLADCVVFRPPAMVVGTYLGGRVIAPGDIAVVDEQRLLCDLVTRCRAHGVILEERCNLVNLAWTPDRVTANTSGGAYRARLVLDATGTKSPIAETFRLHRLDGFLSVHGAYLRKIRLRTTDMILAYANTLGDPPLILEVFPTGNDSAYCAVFTYSTRLIRPSSLDSAFRAQCSRNPFFETTQETEFVLGKGGAIAIGRMCRRQLPGILSIGEAGLVQPPLLGSAFNEILEYNDRVCKHVSRLLIATKDLPRVPSYQYPWNKRVQDRLQLILARMLLKGNVETFDQLVRFMCTLDPSTVYAFCSNELTSEQLVRTACRVPLYLLKRGTEPTFKSGS
jgi:2-polyprenyl-6-methoxyphenol hydroxylase-like FAD-dependent oxidoreductase